MTLRVPGRGEPADKPGLPAGDLFVVIRTADDPRFERHGRDLYRIRRSMWSMPCSGEIEVPTLEGRIPARVDPGTQPDTVLRLRGKGLPQFGGGGRGDLYVSIHIHVPERLSDRQRRLFEQPRETADRKPSSA